MLYPVFAGERSEDGDEEIRRGTVGNKGGNIQKRQVQIDTFTKNIDPFTKNLDIYQVSRHLQRI